MFRRLVNLVFGWKEFRIKKDELVLDIGSGDNPCFRADVICDKYFFDNSQRSGKMKIQIYPHQKFVIGDIQFLPFKDKSFDFVICKHLLEHLDNPGKGIEELMRVAKRGYIETPSSLMEILYGWQFHKWLVHIEGNKLVFNRKDKNVVYGILPQSVKKTSLFDKLVNKNQDVFLIRYFWERKIEYQVNENGNKKEISYLESDLNNINNVIKNEPILKKLLKNFIFKTIRLLWKKHNINLIDILCCPLCKGNIIKEKNIIKCINCKKTYKVLDNFPVLLPQ